MRISPPLVVDDGDARVLRGWISQGRATTARRARIVLLAGDGLGPTAIAEALRCSKQTVITWRERYRTAGIDGLRDAPRSGRPASVDAAAVVRRTLAPPGPGAARWTTRTLAAELGISNVAVANVWRAWGITPGAGGRVRLATEPELESPLTAVAGLYADPRLRMLAVLVGRDVQTGPRIGEVPVERRTALGSGLAGLDTGRPGQGDPAAATRFLAGLPDPGSTHRFGLIVDGSVGEFLDGVEPPGAALHRPARGVPWGRLVRVACLLAGASADGAASVVDLRDAVARHHAGRAFAWCAAHRPR